MTSESKGFHSRNNQRRQNNPNEPQGNDQVIIIQAFIIIHMLRNGRNHDDNWKRNGRQTNRTMQLNQLIYSRKISNRWTFDDKSSDKIQIDVEKFHRYKTEWDGKKPFQKWTINPELR